MSQIIHVLPPAPCDVAVSLHSSRFTPPPPLLLSPTLMGRVALTLFHLRIPHSVNPSSFTPWLQDSLWYLFLLPSAVRSPILLLLLLHHLLSLSPSLSLSLDTRSFSYLRESVRLSQMVSASEPLLAPGYPAPSGGFGAGLL